MQPRSAWTRPRRITLTSGAAVVGAALVGGRILVVTERDVWAFGRGASPSLLARLPHPRTGFGCCGVGNRLFLAGGRPAGARRDDGALLSYDPAAGTWSFGPWLPEPVGHAAVVAAGARIHVLGGLRRGRLFTRTSDEHQIYDTHARAWRLGPRIPAKRFGALAAVVGGSLYVAGGRGAWLFGRDVLSDHHSLGPTTSAWAPEEPLPRGRWDAATAVTPTEIVAVGGAGAGGPLTSGLAFDLAARLWTAIPAAAHSYGGAAAFAAGDTVGIVGTASDGTTALQMITSSPPYEICVPGARPST